MGDHAEAPAALPAFLLTYDQLYQQIKDPLCTINLDAPLQAFKLQTHLKRIHTAISLRCTEFVRGKPKLSDSNLMASIGLETFDRALVLVCFCLKNLYVVGCHVNGIFYEKKKDVNSPGLVQGSTPLGGDGETYGAFGIHPPLTLSSPALETGYYSMTRLGTPDQNLADALYGLGLVALTVIEPSRQATPQRLLVGERGRHKPGAVHGEIGSQNSFWKTTHRWGWNCLTAQGLIRDSSLSGDEDNKPVRENANVNYKERWAALDEVLIFNMSPKITYS